MNLVCPSCATTNRIAPERLQHPLVCGRCRADLAVSEPVALNDQSFPAFIATAQLPVLVDFWAEWCGPCKTFAPHFIRAAQQLSAVRFAKVDTDASPKTSMAHSIRSIPALILFQHGEEVARQSGAMAAGDLVRWVQAHSKL